MNFKKVFTPKDTEQLKPGLFIQTRYKNILNKEGNIIAREPHHYRKIEPVVWDNEYRWKVQLKTVFCLRTMITIALILFIAWSYVSDKQGYKSFFNDVTTNPVDYCNKIYELYSIGELNKESENEQQQNSFTLPNYPD